MDSVLANIRAYIDRLADDSRDIGDDAKQYREARLARLSIVKNWRIWDGNQIQALLHFYPQVRRAFNAFLTPGDVFASLDSVTNKLPLEKLEPALRTHARAALTSEGVVYFDEAGSGERKGYPLHEVAVDLPVAFEGGSRRSSAIRLVLERAEHILKPRLTPFVGPRHLILTGAPGNGKTTLSKYLVQVYRASMLNGASNLSRDQQEIIQGTEVALDRIGRSLPMHRRWPLRIDLAEYAQAGGLENDSTLLRWISQKVSLRSDAGEITPSTLHSWMLQWPWLLVLDGLDEVTAPLTRKRLIEQVTEFVNEAEADDCDVLTILTTRPMGYTEHIAPSQFEQIDLDYLDPEEAVRYGTLATNVRLRGDRERAERVVMRLKEAANDDSLQNLLRTPLQVLILTIIVDGAGPLAPDRYTLFWTYFDAVFRRERDKIGVLHGLLQQHGHLIVQLHQRVGFELQARSEAADRSFATLTYDELKGIAWGVLAENGFKPDGRDAELLRDILAGATHRLVLIAPRGDDGYGFDVRSLQELTAALSMTVGPDEVVMERLRRAAASPHWRNTWIFAAGKIIATPQPHLHEALTTLVEGIDDRASDRLGRVAPIGPRLALDIIDDGMLRGRPNWLARFTAQAIRVLLEPADDDLPAIALVLVRFADSTEGASAAIAEGMRDAMAAGRVANDTVRELQQLIPSIADELGANVRSRALGAVRASKRSGGQVAAAGGWSEFDEDIQTAPLDAPASALADRARAAIHALARPARPDGSDLDALLRAVDDSAVAGVLETAMLSITPHEPRLVLTLRRAVLPMIYRRAIGEALRD